MIQLLGEYDCKIDSKCRLRLPSGLLNQLEEEGPKTFVVNRGFEKCLMLYPEKVWATITEELDRLNLYNKKNRNFVRYFYRGAQKVTTDSADRILINKRLLEYAEIDSDKIILSAYKDRIEIWDKEKYEQMLEIEPEDFANLAEEIMGKDEDFDRGMRAPGSSW